MSYRFLIFCRLGQRTRVQKTLWYFDAYSSVGKVDNAIFSLVFYTGKSHFCCSSQYAKLSDVCRVSILPMHCHKILYDNQIWCSARSPLYIITNMGPTEKLVENHHFSDQIYFG